MSSAEVKKAWIYTSIFPFLHGVGLNRDQGFYHLWNSKLYYSLGIRHTVVFCK
jgi:hypothetical protein